MLCRVCIIAGDISPIDVIIHIPVMCEDRDIPYIYVPSKEVRQTYNLMIPVLCTYLHSLSIAACLSGGK